jgi:predicted RNA-binding Zn ribbon-like protein
MTGNQNSAVPKAPGDLATVQAFVNTLDIEQRTDKFTSPGALASWLAAAGMLEPASVAAINAAALRQALALREALRGVLLSHALDAPPGAAAVELDRIARRLRARLEVSADGDVRPSAAGEGVNEALARLLLIAAEASTAGTWRRLKACSADDCHWAFYDRSPTRNGRWCSMGICGSRFKSRAYRQRAAASRG